MAQWEKLGGILGLLAGTGLAAPEEADGARPWNGKGIADIVEQLSHGDAYGGILGEFLKNDLEQMKKLNSAYTIPEHSIDKNGVEHLRISRMLKPTKNRDKMTPDDIGDMLNSLTTNTRRRVVTARDNEAGLLVPRDGKSYFGVLEPQEGRAGIYTAYKTPTKSLPNKLGKPEGLEGGNPHLTMTPEGEVNTQRTLSAVKPEQGITAIPQEVKRAALIGTLGAGAGAGAALAPENAEGAEGAAYKGIMGKFLDKPEQEPGLERPAWDPVDIALAPIGVPSAGAKIAAMAAEPFISWGVDSILQQLWGDK